MESHYSHLSLKLRKKYGGIKSIEKIDGGSGYDITNPPTVEFEPDYELDKAYASGARVVYQRKKVQSTQSCQIFRNSVSITHCRNTNCRIN